MGWSSLFVDGGDIHQKMFVMMVRAHSYTQTASAPASTTLLPVPSTTKVILTT